MSSVSEWVRPWLREEFTDHTIDRRLRLVACVPSLAASIGCGAILLADPEGTDRTFAWAMFPITAVWFAGLILGACFAMTTALRTESWVRFREIMGPIALFELLLGFGLLMVHDELTADGRNLVGQVMAYGLIPITLITGGLIAGVFWWQIRGIERGAIESFVVPDRSLKAPMRQLVTGLGWSMILAALGVALFHAPVRESWPWPVNVADQVVVVSATVAVGISELLLGRTRYRSQLRPLAMTLLTQTGSLLVALFLFRDAFQRTVLLLPMLMFALMVILLTAATALLLTGSERAARRRRS